MVSDNFVAKRNRELLMLIIAIGPVKNIPDIEKYSDWCTLIFYMTTFYSSFDIVLIYNFAENFSFQSIENSFVYCLFAIQSR